MNDNDIKAIEEIDRLEKEAEVTRKRLGLDDIQDSDIQRKKGLQWVRWLMVYRLKERAVIKKSDWEKEFVHGGDIFDWLMKEGHFREKKGTIGHLEKHLPKKAIGALKNGYPSEYKRVADIWKKTYKPWWQIYKEVYPNKGNQYPVQEVKRQYKFAVEMINGGYRQIR